MSTRIALILALVLGLLTAFAARAWIDAQERIFRENERLIEVTVAARPLRRGRPIRPDDLARFETLQALVVMGMVPWNDRRTLEGRVLIQDVGIGEPVFRNLMELPVERAMGSQSLVTPGMQMITFAVSGEQSHSHMIRPGDYIDILAYMPVDPGVFPIARNPRQLEREVPPAIPPGQRTMPAPLRTVVFAQGVKVIMVDNQTMDMGSTASRAQGYRTLSVEMDPWSAWQLTDARNKGAGFSFPLRARGEAAPLMVQPGGRPTGPIVVDAYDMMHDDPIRRNREGNE